MNNQNPPKLQAPGAGLPLLQKLLLKVYVGPFLTQRDSWDSLERRFEKLYSKILQEAEAVAPNLQTKKILVRPLPGIEDSSRYWSVADTLEHIMIVGEGIKYAMTELSHHRPVPRTVDIANFKPPGAIPADKILSSFKTFLERSQTELKTNIGDRDSKLTLQHPWFGPFKTHQWFWLLSAHGQIHLTQLREIKKQLKAL